MTDQGDARDPAGTDDEPDANAPDDDALDAELVEVAETAGARAPSGAHGTSLRRGTSPLARYDPLAAYMRDVQRYPLLTPEEEHEAAMRLHEHGDVKAAARLVTANLRLVVKIAYEYRQAHQHLPDLIQEGSIGLMHAVKKYDPYKGVKLSTYAAWWIRAYMLRFILNNARLVKLGTTQAQRKLFFNLAKEKQRLTAMGIEPSAEEIAERLGVDPDEVTQMDRRLASGDISLDAPIRSEGEDAPSRVDVLPSRARLFDEQIAEDQQNDRVIEEVRQFGKALRGKEARIFHERLLAEEPRTLQELGEEFGVSRERVRQLEKRLQLKLQRHLAETLGGDVFER